MPEGEAHARKLGGDAGASTVAAASCTDSVQKGSAGGAVRTDCSASAVSRRLRPEVGSEATKSLLGDTDLLEAIQSTKEISELPTSNDKNSGWFILSLCMHVLYVRLV